MKTFMEWVSNLNEAKFRQLDQNQSKALYDALVNTKQIYDQKGYDGIESDVMYAHAAGDKGIEVGEIPFVDYQGRNRPIPVYISYRPDGFGGGYNVQGHYAFIDYTILQHGVNIGELHRTYAHEIGHGMDPRLIPGNKFRDSKRDVQQWASYMKNHADVEDKRNNIRWKGGNPYEIEGPNAAIHYKTPREFEAIGTELAQHVVDYFSYLKPMDKVDMVEELELWLRDTNHDMPEPMQVYADHISQIKQRPTLFRQFQQRMFQLVQQLKQQTKAPAQQGWFANPASQGVKNHPQNYARLNYNYPHDPSPVRSIDG